MVRTNVFPIRRSVSMSGLGQTDGEEPSTIQQITDSLSSVAESYLQYQLQKDALELNLARAQQGLPPINTADYSPGVNVGLSPDTRQLLIIGGIALAGVFVFTQLAKK